MRFIRKYVTPLLLVLFCWYYAGISLGRHIHIVDGKCVSHSHPGAAKGHTHSSSQLATIDILTHFQSEGAESCSHVEKVAVPAVIFECSHIQEIYNSAELSVKTLRGPPQAFFS